MALVGVLSGETQEHLRLSVRMIAWGWAFAGGCCGLWFLSMAIARFI